MKRFAQGILAVGLIFAASTLHAQRPDSMRGPQGEGDRRPSFMRGDGERSGGGPGGGGGRGGGRGRGFSGRGGPGGGGLGGFPGGPPGGPSGPPGMGSSDRFARLEGMLRSMDANGDGMLDPQEVPENRRRLLGIIAQRAGLQVDGPIAIGKIREAIVGPSGGPPEGSRGKSAQPEPLVPGFGVEDDLPPVLGFGERPETADGGQSARPGSSDERVSRMAEMMMRRYDRDGSGRLERHEWGQIRGDPNEIDRDGNGVITREEFVERVAQYVRDRTGGGADEDRRGSDRSGGDARQKGSYRFLTAAERLPEGLPEWFTAQDANGDAQVTMAEYASLWTDSKAREFMRYDLNSDGLVTPDECLEAISRSPPSARPGGEEKKEEKKKDESGGTKPWWMS